MRQKVSDVCFDKRQIASREEIALLLLGKVGPRLRSCIHDFCSQVFTFTGLLVRIEVTLAKIPCQPQHPIQTQVLGVDDLIQEKNK